MKIFNNNMKRFIVLLSLIAGVVFIYSCSNSSSPESGQGQITVTMVDAPADYEHIYIAVARVEAHKTGSDSTSGWVVINSTAATYDLLTLRNGASAVLGNNSLDAGHYTQIRLVLGTGSNIVVNGAVFNLNVPSGMQTGIKLNHEFDIQPGVVYELTLDFNADHSIVHTGNGQYMMNPVIRVVPAVISGTISGTINPPGALAIVNVVSGADSISSIANITTGAFKLMAVIQGTYSVNIISGNPAYSNKTIANVVVVAKQNTDLGNISLTLK